MGLFTELGPRNPRGPQYARGIWRGKREGEVDFHSGKEAAESRQF